MVTAEATQLPREGEELTVLLERGGVPTTHRIKAGRVESTTLLLPRTAATRWPLDAQDRVTVMYHRDGRLYLWPMQVEEVLPSSAWLVGTRAPTAQERRGFVRARMHLGVNLAASADAGAAPLPCDVDLSASGMAVVWPQGFAVGTLLQVVLGDGIGAAEAKVVRCDAVDGGMRLALRFTRLPSVAQERITRLVQRKRELRLIERLERRRHALSGR
jgi:c-di-GMP-binding flagellar brake protein YcgR